MMSALVNFALSNKQEAIFSREYSPDTVIIVPASSRSILQVPDPSEAIPQK